MRRVSKRRLRKWRRWAAELKENGWRVSEPEENSPNGNVPNIRWLDF